MARISGRFVESYGRLVLAESLLKAHFECAEPVQDHGIDLVAFSGRSGKFVTIQLKAATGTRFSIDAKFKGRAAIIAYVFRCRSSEPEVFALTYRQVLGIATKMKYTKSASWIHKKKYSTVVGRELRALLEPYRATPKLWRDVLPRTRF
jgi:hypothetical protein